MDATLFYHFSDEVLCLFLVDTKEIAKLIKVNVHVDATDHDDVVLDQSLLKDCVAISHGDVLMVFQFLEEVFNVRFANDLSNKHLLKKLIELARLGSLIVVQDSYQSCLSWSTRCKYGACDGAVHELIDLLSVDSLHVAGIVVALGRIEELTARVLHFGVGHAIAQDFLLVLRVVQNVHDLRDKAFSSGGVLKLEPVCSLIEPVLNLLLKAVTLITDLFHYLNCFVEIIPCIVDLDDSATEHGILLDKELFARGDLLHGSRAHCNALIVLECTQLLTSNRLKYLFSVLDACLFRDQNSDHLCDVIGAGCGYELFDLGGALGEGGA